MRLQRQPTAKGELVQERGPDRGGEGQGSDQVEPGEGTFGPRSRPPDHQQAGHPRHRLLQVPGGERRQSAAGAPQHAGGQSR